MQYCQQIQSHLQNIHITNRKQPVALSLKPKAKRLYYPARSSALIQYMMLAPASLSLQHHQHTHQSQHDRLQPRVL